MPSSATASREFIFIRHGESESNAGLVTQYPRTVNLTPKGVQQALDAATQWQDAPDVFITSKYLRTQQTAQPFLKKFPHVPSEEWDIHEFTHLDPDKYKGTTFTDRLPHVQAYWEKADPQHKDGALAESFAAFMQRCLNTLERMRQSPHRRSMAFCHGFFMKGLMLAVDGHFTAVNSDTMRRFYTFNQSVTVDNCGIIRFAIQGDAISYTLDSISPKDQ